MTKYEYIWLGGNSEFRSKVKFTNDIIDHDDDYMEPPDWNYDGSSTNQATGNNSEVILRPVKKYRNPYNPTNQYDYFVLCDTWVYDDNINLVPHSTNTRVIAERIFNNFNNDKPIFGIEHEFFVFNGDKPLGFTGGDQGQYYCSVGSKNAFGREFLNNVSDLCKNIDINVTGYNLEVAPGQMEIQLCAEGINAGDDSMMLKYILEREGEKYGYTINWSAKPLEGNWNGSGCHVNFSTEKTRAPNGYNVILDYMKKLESKHTEHINLYGLDNHLRLTGNHETSDINTFSFGIADRGCSIRIPKSTIKNNCGYFEDRRPSSSADMYLVTSKLYDSCCN